MTEPKRMLVDGTDWTDSRIIASQRERIATLEAENAELRKGYDARGETLRYMGDAVERMEQAEAENAALRENLDRLVRELDDLRSLVPETKEGTTP